MKGLFLLLCIITISAVDASKTSAFALDSNKYIRLQLAGNTISARDETVILFKKGAKPEYAPGEDARYLQGAGQVRLYSYSSNQVSLVFNFLPFPAKTLQISLNVFARTDGRYELKMPEVIGIPALYDIWLMDNMLEDSLDFRNNPTYSFNVSKADTNSFGGKRFKLVIKRNKARELHLLNFTADKATGSKQVRLEWRAENEGNSTSYVVERSTDKGRTFNVLDSLKSSGKGSYGLADLNPDNESALYRLKQTDLTDYISYSAIISVNNNNMVKNPAHNINTTISPNIYPNPVASVLNVAMANKSSMATYSISVTNIYGLKVKEGTMSGTAWQSEVGDLKPGMYMVTVTNNSDKSVVGFNKFLKQ